MKNLNFNLKMKSKLILLVFLITIAPAFAEFFPGQKVFLNNYQLNKKQISSPAVILNIAKGYFKNSINLVLPNKEVLSLSETEASEFLLPQIDRLEGHEEFKIGDRFFLKQLNLSNGQVAKGPVSIKQIYKGILHLKSDTNDHFFIGSFNHLIKSAPSTHGFQKGDRVNILPDGINYNYFGPGQITEVFENLVKIQLDNGIRPFFLSQFNRLIHVSNEVNNNVTENKVEVKDEVKNESEGEGDNLCNICMNSEINAVLTPCGHFGGCYECMEPIKNIKKECPFCRTKIEGLYKVFKP